MEELIKRTVNRNGSMCRGLRARPSLPPSPVKAMVMEMFANRTSARGYEESPSRQGAKILRRRKPFDSPGTPDSLFLVARQ